MVIELLQKGVSPIKDLITSKIKLSDIVKRGFDALGRPDSQEIKVLVQPGE